MLTTTVIKNIKIPLYIRSDHQKLTLGSEELQYFMEQELLTLKAFDNLCQSHDIFYSLIAGSLMSYYMIGEPYPWDDDIDVIMQKKDYQKLFQIFQVLPGKGHTHFHRIWICKKIQIAGEDFWLGLHKYNNDWMKIFKAPGMLDVGGIDFGFMLNKNGKTYESMNKDKICPIIEEKSLRRVSFGGINTFVIQREIAEKYLDAAYDTSWRELSHPDYRLSSQQQYARHLIQTCKYTLRHLLLRQISEKWYTWHLRMWYFDYKKEQIIYLLRNNRLIKKLLP